MNYQLFNQPMWRLTYIHQKLQKGKKKGQWAGQPNMQVKGRNENNQQFVKLVIYDTFNGRNTTSHYFPFSICTGSFQLQVQCSVFEGAIGDVALTAGGGLRLLPGLNETFESVALVLISS